MFNELANPSIAPVPTVNFHLVRSCNMRCGFCFARFEDVKRDTGVPGLGLPTREAVEVIDALVGYGFKKLTFAGGEPTLRADLPDLIAHAKASGLITAVVTNGSRLDETWIERVAPHLDQLALSVDSGDPAIRLAMGRAVAGKHAVPNATLFSIADTLRRHGVHTKLNSVVTSLNAGDDMSAFVRRLAPARWKIFQALRIEGQNETGFPSLACPSLDYAEFVSRHRAALTDSSVVLVPEDNTAMTASYAMVDPFGRFFDNFDGRLHYSPPIRKVGARAAFAAIRLDIGRFAERGGHAGLEAAA